MILWAEKRGFLKATAFYVVMTLLLLGIISQFVEVEPDKPDWVLPLGECIVNTELAAETHAYAIVWMELNPDADWHNFGSIERQEYWENLHRSSKWWMENR